MMISRTTKQHKNGLVLNSIIGYFTKSYILMAIWIALISVTTIKSSLITTNNNNNNNNEEEQQNLENLCTQFPTMSECLQSLSMEKRKSAYMRFGRSAVPLTDAIKLAAEQNGDISMEKRKSAYMRFGKRSFMDESFDEDDEPKIAAEKRKSAYMRFGKRKSAYMRFGKRSMNNDYQNGMEKRKSAYMRFGRR